MDNEELRKIAHKRLKAQSDFKHYLLIWLAVTILVVGVWFITSPGGFFWPVWVIGGMGIAAVFSGIDAYGPGRGAITDDKVDAEVRRMTKGS